MKSPMKSGSVTGHRLQNLALNLRFREVGLVGSNPCSLQPIRNPDQGGHDGEFLGRRHPAKGFCLVSTLVIQRIQSLPEPHGEQL